MNSKQAKRISIITFLEALSILPAKINSKSATYYSPFRHERNPSFKVDILKNLWFDHGERKGGNIIDLGIKLLNCSLSELLKRIENLGLEPGYINKDIMQSNKSTTSGELKVLKVSPLTDINLLNYIKSRGVDLKIATTFCKQARYSVGDMVFLSIAFQNSKGGYELQNVKGEKYCSSPKWITHIKNNSGLVTIFEGYMDFMSLLTMEIVEFRSSDYIVLNSVNLLKEIPGILSNYQTVHLYLDTDGPGVNATKWILNQKIDTCIFDKSDLYKDYDDLNELLKDMIKKGKWRNNGLSNDISL